MSDNVVRVEGLTRSFGALLVLDDISLEIGRGEFVAVVGPSGCGKTTFLNLVSGFDRPTSGQVTRAGVVRMVYQQDGLFPWLTVAENIALGLRDMRDEREAERQLAEMFVLIGLEEFANHYPHQLSGGMRQRVELARALAAPSDILLLDEPFSSLDYLTRLRMRDELARLLTERPRTVVLVTHDIEEAAQLADRIVVLTERPARISRELRLDVPRPRELTHPEVVAAVHGILMDLGIERDAERSAVPGP
ncbi:MAG TPA: ABC transporter ATP-binding protein [Blastocatellia bacterium]|nr:ABC transporter ATP-binding protein [Blastocatellia bacterium]